MDKPQRGRPKRAELPDVNINTGVQRINTETGVSLEDGYRRSTTTYVASHRRLLNLTFKRVVVVILSRETGRNNYESLYFILSFAAVQTWMGKKRYTEQITGEVWKRDAVKQVSNSYKVTATACVTVVTTNTSRKVTSIMDLGRSLALNSCSMQSMMFFQPSRRMSP